MTDEEILVEQEKLVAENHAGRERSNWQREKRGKPSRARNSLKPNVRRLIAHQTKTSRQTRQQAFCWPYQK
jgi:hypothetical protein